MICQVCGRSGCDRESCRVIASQVPKGRVASAAHASFVSLLEALEEFDSFPREFSGYQARRAHGTPSNELLAYELGWLEAVSAVRAKVLECAAKTAATMGPRVRDSNVSDRGGLSRKAYKALRGGGG